MADILALAVEKKMLRRILACLATFAFMSFLFPAVPSQAETNTRSGTDDCPLGYLCVWEHPNYQGRMYRFAGANASWAAWDINNKDSSWYNNGTEGMLACVWSGTNYQGSVKVIQHQTSSPSDSTHGDRGSSNSWAHFWC
ncbi:peptidase inhibitor family I36 protein [Nocardiopsis sp. EMB25]|uniref:peptidase inhibitor family I36 protein n=1 Tax=Nocardiopsis sp. EMB25 TaxID=2835867 RepID=UPI003FA3D1BE